LQTTSLESKLPNKYIDVIFIKIDRHLEHGVNTSVGHPSTSTSTSSTALGHSVLQQCGLNARVFTLADILFTLSNVHVQQLRTFHTANHTTHNTTIHWQWISYHVISSQHLQRADYTAEHRRSTEVQHVHPKKTNE